MLIIDAQRRISVMIPTRKRVGMLRKSIQSLIDNASDMNGIELLIAIDNDDADTANYLYTELAPILREKDISMQAFSFERMGYKKLHEYSNFLARKSAGNWIMLWNDDAIMTTKNWDLEIEKFNGQFKVLRFKANHNEHPNSIFPCVPREWLILFETFCPHPAQDTWISTVAYAADIMQDCYAVEVYHDRFDLTGNNNDEVLQERQFQEGNADDPYDLNHQSHRELKFQWSKKIDWYLKKLGQSTGWLDRWIADPINVDIFQKYKDNDPNKQCFVNDGRPR